MKTQGGDRQGSGMRSVGRASRSIGKFYAVKRGHQTGIFHSWPECQVQITHFPGCLHKSFKSREEAEAWLQAPITSPAPRRHSIGPAQVTGASGGGPSPYMSSPPPRHSLSPQPMSSFSPMGLPHMGTPQMYPSPSPSPSSATQSGYSTAQRPYSTTPQSSALYTLQAAMAQDGVWRDEGPAAEPQGSENVPLSAWQAPRAHEGEWYSLEFDGASKGNPGRGGVGAVLKDPSGAPILYITQGMANTTSNRAEYSALIAGLQEALALGIPRLQVQGDSQLVIFQCLGQWKVQHPGLVPLAQEAKGLMGQFQEVEMRHVPREQNKLADRLSNDAVALPDGVRHKATTYQARV